MKIQVNCNGLIGNIEDFNLLYDGKILEQFNTPAVSLVALK